MLEKYLSRILTSKFEHIVEDFDQDDVNISAWKGEVSLKNLVLKQTALDTFGTDMPVEVVYGKVGSLELQIPWSSLGSKSSSVVLTDVCLLVTPRKAAESKAEEEEEMLRTKKKNKTSKEENVQALLNPRILQHSIAASTKKNRLARLLSWISSSVFSNLSVTVKNIHIRYEDPGSSMGFVWNDAASNSAFAVGLTLQQFSVQNTNIADHDSTTDDDKFAKNYEVKRKLAAAYQLAVYWDHDCPLVAVQVRKMTDPIAARQHAEGAFSILEQGSNPQLPHDVQRYRIKHSYVLQPFSPSVQFNLYKATGSVVEKNAVAPPSTVTLSLPPCHFVVSRSVLENVAFLRKSAAFWKQSLQAAELNETLNHLYRIRPSESPLSDCRTWWRYAIEATVVLGRSSQGQKRRRKGWSAFAFAVLERQKYKSLYHRLDDDDDKPDVVHAALGEMEEDLEEAEIAMFRLAAYESMLDLVELPDATKPDEQKTSEAEAVAQEIASGNLSVDVRKSMMYDAIRILKEGRTVTSRDEDVSEEPVDFEEESPLQWKTSLFCPDLSLQVNGRISNNSERPIARLSFACVQRQYLHRDGSWELDATVAAFKMVDMGSKGTGYATLIDSKKPNDGVDNEDDFVTVSGQRFRQCMQIQIQRSFAQLSDGIGSTTHSSVRLQPLEVVYSTDPVARLADVFSSIRTPELVGDYQRVASVVSEWRERQRQRLLQALAHKRKTITVDIDVSAPVILIPESLNEGGGSMLVIDLGRVQFRNIEPDEEFNDAWSLELSEMQVQSSRFLSSRDIRKRFVSQQIVEPFSLECKISTTVASKQAKDPSGRTTFLIDASLPRLVFNVRSSSVRLVSRLQRQWTKTRRSPNLAPRRLSYQPPGNSRFERRSSKAKVAIPKVARVFRVVFSAPIIAVKLADDAKDHEQSSQAATPLVNLALRGIGGNFVQTVATDDSSTSEFHAKMRSLEAVDLYQQAGQDFALLLSSVSPSSMPNVSLQTLADLPEQLVRPDINKDLVSVKYDTRSISPSNRGGSTSISIKFYELFVEWNPETIAAIHRAVKVPVEKEPAENPEESPVGRQRARDGAQTDSDDEFFDAQDGLHESYLSAAEIQDDNSAHDLSEISSARSSLASEEFFPPSPANEMHGLSPNALSPSSHSWGQGSQSLSWKRPSLQPILAGHLSPMYPMQPLDDSPEKDETPLHEEVFKPFDLSFELSTLRVNFNKETRHRRLLVAEMDRTTVRRCNTKEGGSRTVAKIGNLVFTDPMATDNSTLYGQILGLKTDGVASGHSEPSLLELEFVVNDRKRNFDPLLLPYLSSNVESEEREMEVREGVTINTATGEMRGCNFFVHLRFSPMRFVYLQQLWFEIIDYFFEGIVGFEVWGNKRPKPFDATYTYVRTTDLDEDEQTRRTPDLPGADANGVGFTRFHISLASPDVLLPVEYKSPHFMRVTCHALEVSNRYSSRVHQVATEDGGSRDQVQWYNTCSIDFQKMRLQSWCGTDLTKTEATVGSEDGLRPDGRVQMTWPTGPTAKLVVPKWRVRCDFDAVNLVLRSEDYALFQHVVVFNLGEPSRHLDEWARFQEMTLDELDAYKESIMVHYGYDKKDTAPSTYDVEVLAPSVGFELLGKNDEKEVIAHAKCLNLVWTMRRLPDYISRQRLVSNIILSRPTSKANRRAVPLLLPTKRGTALDGRPDVVYTSTTKPNGDNVKTLDVMDAGINLLFPAWMDALDFFSGLGEPSRMTAGEIENSLQIGDRWYSMGKNEEVDDVDQETAPSKEKGSLSANYQFKLLLDSPRIVVDSENDGNSVILHMDHLDFLHVNDNLTSTVNRSFFVHNLELYTISSSGSSRDVYSVENSLISPWSFVGRSQRCNEAGKAICESHSFQIAAEVLKARAAYSDLSIALDVAVRVAKDFQDRKTGRNPKSETPLRSPRSEGTKDNDQGSLEQLNATDKEDDSSHCVKRASTMSCHCEGVEILVVDDSLRQFASAQELFSFSLRHCLVLNEQGDITSWTQVEGEKDQSPCASPSSRLVVRVASLDLFDHLQRKGSRFCLAATTKDATSESNTGQKKSAYAFHWPMHSSVEVSVWGFAPSTSLVDALGEATLSLSMEPGQYAIEYESINLPEASRRHKLNVRSFTMQWNPSTVIALQRFLGRLLKEVRLKSSAADALLASSNSPQPESPRGVSSASDPHSVPMQAIFEIGSLTVCLNKEHQNRRLLKAVLTGIGVSLDVAVNADSTYVGCVEDVQAWDEDDHNSTGMVDANRSVLRVQLKGKRPSQDPSFAFFRFRYKKYAERGADHQQEAPSWIVEKLQSAVHGPGERIDDHLSISVASVQLTYIRGRTEELMDYLSNGLPGKGMGVTSKAAKGFINKRIQTRSFLDLNIAAPQLRIPQHESSANGVFLRLGDVQLKTWFELHGNKDGLNRNDWYRVLSVSVLGLGWNTYFRHETNLSDALPIDLHFDLRKPMDRSKATVLQGSLSFVEMLLKYTDYCLLHSLLKDNVGKKPDMSKWENVEKAFWMETENDKDSSQGHTPTANESEYDVAYSSSARLVQYGTKGRLVANASSLSAEGSPGDAIMPSSVAISKADKVFDFGFKMNGIRLTLHRDDDIDSDGVTDSAFASKFHYDVVVLRLDAVEVSFALSSDRETSLHATLSRISLFDLGDTGRLVREQYFLNLATLDTAGNATIGVVGPKRNPCAFAVIAEGYSPTMSDKARGNTRPMDQPEPQIVLTVDTCPASTGSPTRSSVAYESRSEKTTVARMVINYLSINAMIRPLREIVSFLSCGWSAEAQSVSTEKIEHDKSSADETGVVAKSKSRSTFQLKLVAHYPRVFFVADEADMHSRALVLRGLAVVNASIHQESSTGIDHSNAARGDAEQVISLDANLHSMESFINPDVSVALGGQLDETNDCESKSTVHTLGVALIQPVTAGVDFRQVSKERFPTIRSVNLNMEAVSTMLSFEDLSLINQLLRRWSPEGKSNNRRSKEELDKKAEGTIQFDISVEAPRLGVELKNTIDGVVVDNIKAASTPTLDIEKGDRLVLIDGIDLSGLSLQRVVQMLAKRPRPMILTFVRNVKSERDTAASTGNNGGNISVSTETRKRDKPIPSGGDKFPVGYKLHFRMGTPNGFVIERTHGGDIPIISGIDLEILSQALVGADVDPVVNSVTSTAAKIPPTGTAIVAVSGLKSVDLGFDETARVLEEFAKPSFANESEELKDTAVYTISFLELSSGDWGSIDSFDASIAGMALTFIDDYEGRDMPLLRGKLSSVELHCERGVGLLTDIIDTATASVFGTVAAAIENPESRHLVEEGADAFRDISYERISKISGSYQANIDYYHPRIAVWEPLLEPSRLALNTVWKPGISSGAQKRPGQLAMELSDELERGHAHVNRAASSSVSVNITDAAAEVVARTLRQLSKWRGDKSEIPSHPQSALEDRINVDATYAKGTTTNENEKVKCVSDEAQDALPRRRSIHKKRAAAKEAAQAALVFAQKRGAEIQKTGESAKPFIFRNRTGIELQFCDQLAASIENPASAIVLEDNPAAMTVPVDNEARFQMEIVSADKHKSQSEDGTSTVGKKVRSYEGTFPHLAVWIHCNDKSTNFEPLLNLQVSKVGTFLRDLTVVHPRDDLSSSATIPLLWKVELDENRRILTLSSAVQVSPIALGLSLDLGYIRRDNSVDKSTIESLGSVAPGDTFFLPLWMFLHFGEQEVYVRPCCANSDQSTTFEWSGNSVLKYGRQPTTSTWMWRETFSQSCSVACKRLEKNTTPIWLSCLTSPVAVDGFKKRSVNKRGTAEYQPQGIVNLIFDSSITLRNMLPIGIQWELADVSFNMLERSARESQESESRNNSLGPGSCVEALSCNVTEASVRLRVRPIPHMTWTDWALVANPTQNLKSNDDDGECLDLSNRVRNFSLTHAPASDEEKDSPGIQETVVHTVSDFGCPVHVGIRLTPKLNEAWFGQPRCYGLDVVVFASLWFRNLTNMHINFGCPWNQLNPQGAVEELVDDFSAFEAASKAAAESALMEIASVLEFGDKGKVLAAKDQEKEEQRNVRSLPLQTSEALYHEVFEYIEVESSTVKRRWWASEQHDSHRQEIADYPERGAYWEWTDDAWLLDSSGKVRETDGAWESCRSLTGGRESYFSGNRTIDVAHRFRRRRWFRRLRCDGPSFGLQKGISCFHHPIVNPLIDNERGVARQETKGRRDSVQSGGGVAAQFSLRCRDGEWSSMASIPLSGPAEGIIRVLSSRWPTITRTTPGRPRKCETTDHATLTPEVYDLCYSISELPGDWGEFSRMVTVTPRFLLRNESSSVAFEAKQAGVSDQEAIIISPGDDVPFYWSDFRLPQLVCVRPVADSSNEYRWSGGFDICTLGTVPLRIRSKSFGGEDGVFSVKALVEIRPRSSGVNISLNEEDAKGIGSMFRVENHSPFPIWIAQDGVLANPSLLLNPAALEQSTARRHFDQVHNLSDRPPEIDGDVVLPRNRRAFALDVPFRQGKYAKRKAATLEELLRVRIGLAPLSTRDGIETTKVISFTAVGESMRLNPGKLRSISGLGFLIGGIRVLGVVATDGPTRVLRFCLMGRSALKEQVGYSSKLKGVPFQPISKGEELLCQVATKAAMEAIELKESGKLPKESEAKREAFFDQQDPILDSDDLENDVVFSFRAFFSGFFFSLVDSAPSEIATVSIKSLETAAKWNMNRTGDATAIVSVGWLQIDNHVPNAPFPVAVCPDQRDKLDVDAKIPLLMMSLKFAPKHKSGILCLRSVTIAPSNLAIAIDLAFIVRVQRLLASVHRHFISLEIQREDLVGLETIPFPDVITDLNKSKRSDAESHKLYFEGFVILPSNVNLSVAPARALTPAQSLLEGSEAAAIHAAVRKGDVRLADGGMVGVSVGRTNRTAMAVVRGVFKSILVDALLRLDGASLDLAGVSLRNHTSSSRQLTTYLVAHYLASLRNNVPALLGSLAAFGNPLGLIRGIGDGVSDFVNEPVKGLKRSVEEFDPFHVVDGVARGTESLARHTVGGIADSASMLTETFSKNMAVLTLDRRYAQRRDIVRSKQNEELNFVEGVESGVAQLVRGVIEGVTGVVNAPLRGAERSGVEGFAKGIGKGLLGLLVKPVIGLSDAATDLMIGVKGSVDGGQSARGVHRMIQLRPRRTLYGKDRTLRVYSLADAAAATLMLRTKLAGDNYLCHLDMGDRVLLVSDKKFVLLGSDGQELLFAKFKHVLSIDLRPIELDEDRRKGWGVFITLTNPRSSDGTRVEVLRCGDNQKMATQLLEQLQGGPSSR